MACNSQNVTQISLRYSTPDTIHQSRQSNQTNPAKLPTFKKKVCTYFNNFKKLGCFAELDYLLQKMAKKYSFWHKVN